MPPQSQQQSSGDNALAPVWIMALIFFTLYVLWTVGHGYIVSFVFYLNILQAKIIKIFVHSNMLEKSVRIMKTIDPSAVTWDLLLKLTRVVGNYVRYPVIIINLILAYLLYRSNVTLKFRKNYNMDLLRKQEQHNWPAIMPVIKYDLIKMDINKGPWAMALTPMEFARKYNLLKKDDALIDSPMPGLEMTAGIKRGDAKRVFTLQLGPYWDGFDRCPLHVQAVAAVFMARMNRDRAAAVNILETIDKTFSEGKPDFSVAKDTLKKYEQTEMVQEILNQHAYLLTAMASLLLAARADGVVASADFLWLKLVDRRLWYMLNCVGRQTPYVEVAGPFAHWLAEKRLGRRSLVPMIDEAIKALEIAIKDVKLSPKELQELQP